MRTVKIHRDKLLELVKANKETHRSEFLRAQEGFRAQLITRLDAMLADARANRRLDLLVGLPAPMDQTKDYERVIRQLELSVETVIELSDLEFAQYVLDEWGWKQQTTAVNSSYLS